MRKRFSFSLPAGGTWPDVAVSQNRGIGAVGRFNWVRVENRDDNAPVLVQKGLDAGDYLGEVAPGSVRVFNVAGPIHDPAHEDAWWDSIRVTSLAGASAVVLEIADHPIVDLVQVIGGTPTGIAPGQTVTAFGTLTNPTAGAQLASIPIASTPPGYYDITITIGFGSVAGTVNNNFNLFASNAFVGRYGIDLVAGASETFTAKGVFENGVNAIQVTIPVLDSAGIYNAQISATPASALP